MCVSTAFVAKTLPYIAVLLRYQPRWQPTVTGAVPIATGSAIPPARFPPPPPPPHFLLAVVHSSQRRAERGRAIVVPPQVRIAPSLPRRPRPRSISSSSISRRAGGQLTTRNLLLVGNERMREQNGAKHKGLRVLWPGSDGPYRRRKWCRVRVGAGGRGTTTETTPRCSRQD